MTQETFEVRFLCHKEYHSYLTGFIESKVKVFKKSFSTFNTSLTYNELNCALNSIAKVVNCRPLGLFRQQTINDIELSCVTPFSLMCSSLSPNEHESMNILSKNEGDNDISSVMSKIRRHTSRILNKYLDLVL